MELVAASILLIIAGIIVYNTVLAQQWHEQQP